MGGSSVAKRDEIEQRRVRVAGLLKGGVDRRSIAKALGVSRATVWRDTDTLRSRWREEQGIGLQQHIDQMAAQLDDVLMANVNAMRSGDVSAGDLCLKALRQKAALLGLEAPKRVDQHFSGYLRTGPTIEELIIGAEKVLVEQGYVETPPALPEKGVHANDSSIDGTSLQSPSRRAHCECAHAHGEADGGTRFGNDHVRKLERAEGEESRNVSASANMN
jgi:hypothetical protein